MTTAAWVFLGAAAVLAVLDWIAVARGTRALEYVAKPGATLALVGVAATLEPLHGDTRTLFVLALLASLAGDVFLMLPGDRFVAGLASFLVAQALYTAGFALHGGSAADYLVGALVATALVVPLSLRFVGALRRSDRGGLVPPVAVYMGAIGAMAASAVASGNAFAVVGALLFVTSDALIAETRFVGARPWGPVAIMVTYHLAQAGLVLSLLA
jgi:uncharacterized membrane protein YhhN